MVADGVVISVRTERLFTLRLDIFAFVICAVPSVISKVGGAAHWSGTSDIPLVVTSVIIADGTDMSLMTDK